MFVMSVDIGSRNTAFSILKVENNNTSNNFTFELIKSVYLYLSADKIGSRLLLLQERFEKEIVDNCIDTLIFEDSKFSGRFAPDLHYCCSIVHIVGAKYNIPVRKLSPTAVKKILTKSGKADKAEVEEAVKSFLSNPPEKFQNDHCADSAGIGIAYFLNLK